MDVEAWHIEEPQFKMAKLLGESVNEVKRTLHSRIFALGITEHYNLSMCLCYYQIQGVLLSSRECAEHCGHMQDKKLADAAKMVGRKRSANIPAEHLSRIKAYRSRDMDLDAHVRSIVMQRVEALENCTSVTLIC